MTDKSTRADEAHAVFAAVEVLDRYGFTTVARYAASAAEHIAANRVDHIAASRVDRATKAAR